MLLSRQTVFCALSLFVAQAYSEEASEEEVSASDPVAVAASHADRRPQTQYKESGNGLDGFDCTGLTKYAYGRFGIDLPRSTIDQATVGDPVEGELKRGDLILFDATEIPSGKATHAGIYEGDNKFIQANAPQYGVERTDLDSRGGEGNFWSGVSWRERIVEKRRLPTPPGPSTTFTVGDVVEVKKEANVRTDPLGLDADLLKTPLVTQAPQTPPVKGIIDFPPVLSNGNWRWRVNFESGPDGWVAEDYLKKSNVVPPPPFSSVLSRTVVEGSPIYESTGYGYYRKDRFTNISSSPIRLDSVQFLYLDPEDVGIRDIYTDAANKDTVYAAAENSYPEFDFWGLYWVGSSGDLGYNCSDPTDPAFGYPGGGLYQMVCGDPDRVTWTNSMTFRNLHGVVLYPGQFIDIEHTAINNLTPEFSDGLPTGKDSELVVGFRFRGITNGTGSGGQ